MIIQKGLVKIKMGTDRGYARFAELYYERNLPIKERLIQDGEGVVRFQDGDSIIEVSGSGWDFFAVIQNLVPTVRGGVEQFIDVRDTPAKNSRTRERNMRYFRSEHEDPVQKATARLQRGDGNPPDEFDAKKALDSSLKPDLTDEDLQKLIKNYDEIIAIKNSDANRINAPYNKYKKKASYDSHRFEEVFETAVDLLQAKFLSGSPLARFEEWENKRNTDLLELGNKVLNFNERKQVEWEGLKSREAPSDEDVVINFWDNNSDDVDGGRIEGSIGIERIIEQYAYLFELVREPLQDLAFALEPPKPMNMNDTASVLQFLDSNGGDFFTDLIEPQLRHGSSHASIETDDSEGIVSIYDGRGRDRDLIIEMPYYRIPVEYYRLSDLVAALLFAITRVDNRVCLRYMSSNEFRYRMADNIPPEGLPS